MPPIPETARAARAADTSTTTSSEATRSIAFGGYRFQYRYLGSPHRDYEPVLLLGGAFQTMRSLEKFARVLTAYTSVILVDLPGSGDSDLPPPQVGAEFLAGCLREVLDRIGVRRVNLVGVSFGTAIAYTAAQLFPERIDRLVLIGTMSRIDHNIARALEVSLEALDSGDKKAFSDRVSSVLLNHARRDDIVEFTRATRLLRAAVERMSAREREQFRVNSQRLLLHRRLDTRRTLRPRTLVFTGEFDSVTTPACCREVAETARESHLALVRSSDHLLPLERFDLCTRLVDTFLRGGSLEGIEGCTSVRELGQRASGHDEREESTTRRSAA